MEEFDLKDIFNIFWNKKHYIIVTVLIFAMLGMIYTMFFVTPEYQSSTTLVLAKTDSTVSEEESITQTELTLNQKLVSTYSEIVKSKNVIRKVKENLDLNIDEEVLKKNITVSAVKDTEVIKIIVRGENPYNCAKIANEIAEVFTEKVSEIYNINNVYVLDQAEADEVPYNINHAKDIILFIGVGIVLASVIILVANLLDTTVKNASDIEKNLELTVLAEMPISNGPAKKTNRR